MMKYHTDNPIMKQIRQLIRTSRMDMNKESSTKMNSEKEIKKRRKWITINMALPEKVGTLSQVGHVRRGALHLTGDTSGETGGGTHDEASGDVSGDAPGEASGEMCAEAGEASKEAGGNIRT